MKCQILFSRKNTKMFKMSAEAKFNIQHFEIFFLFLPRKQKPVFGEKYQLVIACGISPESEKRLRCTDELTIILKYTCEIYK